MYKLHLYVRSNSCHQGATACQGQRQLFQEDPEKIRGESQLSQEEDPAQKTGLEFAKTLKRTKGEKRLLQQS